MIEESAPAPTAGRGSNVEQDPTTEPEDKRKQRRKRLVDLAIGSTFLIPGLAISGWSMYSYMRESTNAPAILCLGASAAFDGIGLYAAKKANERAEKGRKAKFAWIVTWAAVAASVVINWRHASTQHWNEGIHILISAPAAAAAAAFEIMMQETRETERDKHEKRIRTRRPVKIDLDIWLHHPLKVWGSRRKESAQRLDEALALGARTIEAPAPRPTGAPSPAPHGAADSDGAPRPAAGAPQSEAPRLARHGAPAPRPAPRGEGNTGDGAPSPAPHGAADSDGAPSPTAPAAKWDQRPAPRPIVSTFDANGAPVGAIPLPRDPWSYSGDVDQDDTDDNGPDTETFARIDWDGDLAKLDAAEPPAWRDLSKAEAVRRCVAILPDLSASQVADLLKAKGVKDVTANYVRNVRSRDKANGAVIPMRQRGAAS